MKSKGLGDTIEKMTIATGIKKMADKYSKITGKDCGCSKRKEALNKAFPYGKGSRRFAKLLFVQGQTEG
jgi:hypothetical protein